MWVAGLCQNGFQNVLHRFSSENCHSMLGISTQTYFKISLQLAKQLAEYLKVHPLLKIQLMTNDPFELTFQKYSNDSLTSKVFLKDKKKSAMGRERKLSGRTKKNVNSATSFLKPAPTTETFFAWISMLFINVVYGLEFVCSEVCKVLGE